MLCDTFFEIAMVLFFPTCLWASGETAYAIFKRPGCVPKRAYALLGLAVAAAGCMLAAVGLAALHI